MLGIRVILIGLFIVVALPLINNRDLSMGESSLQSDRFISMLPYFGLDNVNDIQYQKLEFRKTNKARAGNFKLYIRFPEKKQDEVEEALLQRQSELDSGWITPEGYPMQVNHNGKLTDTFIKPDDNDPAFSTVLHNIDLSIGLTNIEPDGDAYTAIVEYDGPMSTPDNRWLIRRGQLMGSVLAILLAVLFVGAELLSIIIIRRIPREE